MVDTIARNHSVDRLRARRMNAATMEEIVELPDAAPSPEALAIAGSERAQIDRCLDELKPDRATAVRISKGTRTKTSLHILTCH